MDRDDFARSQIETLRRRVEELESHLRRVFDHLGLEGPPEVTSAGADTQEQVLTLLREGKTLEAITTYRGLTGSDLGGAKAAVERIKAENGL